MANSTKKVTKKQPIDFVSKKSKVKKVDGHEKSKTDDHSRTVLSLKGTLNLEVPDIQQILGGKLLFSSESQEEEVFHQDDLVQLFPFGVSITPDLLNPFVLLKDKTLDLTLPVSIHPIEASSVLNSGSKSQVPYNPHYFLGQILESLDIKILQCVFVQLKGPRQFVRIYFQGHQKLNSIKLPADQVVSLCISLNVPLFATRKFINQSKLLNVQIEGVTQNLIQNQRILLKNSSYIQ